MIKTHSELGHAETRRNSLISPQLLARIEVGRTLEHNMQSSEEAQAEAEFGKSSSHLDVQQGQTEPLSSQATTTPTQPQTAPCDLLPASSKFRILGIT